MASKAQSVSSIPKGFHTITPYLIASDVSRLIDFHNAGI